MALVKVYDLDGQEHEKESVDARECVQVLGWSMTSPAQVGATVEIMEGEPGEGEQVDGQGLEPVKRGRKPKGD